MNTADTTNEFVYFYDKPFDRVEPSIHGMGVIIYDNNELILKTLGVDICYTFNDENKKELYVFDSSGRTITAYNTFVQKTQFSAIPSSTVHSDMYFINHTRTNGHDKLNHFTINTKIRELVYYNDTIKRVFLNNALSINIKSNSKKLLRELRIQGKFVNDNLLGQINTDENKISLYLCNAFGYNQNLQGEQDITVKNKSHIVMKFRKGIIFDEVFQYIRLLDCVFYMMTYLKRRHHEIYLHDYSGHRYSCHDRFADISHIRIKDRNYMICTRSEAQGCFIKLFERLLAIEKDSKNILLPIMNYDSKFESVETAFLEYYKVLEHIHIKEQEAKGKGKDTCFIVQLLRRYSNLKQLIFGHQSEKELGDEIRSLRNYYAHTGFYVKDLPIKKSNVVVRYKTIDHKWLYDVLKFVKTTAYLEIYRLCEINANSNMIVHEL